MKIEKNSGSLPTWLDNFVCKFQTKTKIATKNVQNLPQVKWKNETYYVNLTDDGAVLYNDQANEVMSLDGVKSIDQVNDALNKDSVVASTDGNDSTDSQFSNEDEEKTVTSDCTVDTTGTNIFGEPDIPNEVGPTGPDNSETDQTNPPFGVDKDEMKDLAKDSEFESELEKVADLEDGMPQQEDESADAGQMASEQTETTASVDGINEGIDDISGQQHESIDDISGQQHESIEEAGTDKYQNNANSASDTDINPDELVTKASYNRLLAKVKQLEKKLSAMDKKAGDGADGDGPGVGFQDIANGISNAWDTASGAVEDAFGWAQQQSQGENGTFDARDSKKDVKCKHRLISSIDKKAEDWSGDSGSVGFQDIADGIGDAVSSIGDTVGDAVDWATQQSQGENGTFDARDSKKDVKCKQCLISSVDKKADLGETISNGIQEIGDAIGDAANVVSDGANALWNDLAGASRGEDIDYGGQQDLGGSSPVGGKLKSEKDVKCKYRLISSTDKKAGDDQINNGALSDDPVNNPRGIDVGSVNNKKKHLIADIPEGGINLTDLPGYSDAVQDVDMNGREDAPASSMTDDPDSNDLHNAEQFGGIFGKKDKSEKTAFTEAQHAYTAPENDAYDLNSQDEEVKHFNDSANQTQKVLNKEHELDLSNMNDRAKLNEYFLLDLDNDIDDMALDDEEIVPDETVKELTTEDVPVEEVPQEEIVEEDSPAVEEIEIPVAEEDIPVIEDENPTILVLDNPESIEEFENQICPICHQQKSLAGVQNAGDYVGVVCNHCGQEYAVGNDKIFVRK